MNARKLFFGLLGALALAIFPLQAQIGGGVFSGPGGTGSLNAASQAEVNAGVVTNKAVTPATLAAYPGLSNTNALTPAQSNQLANALQPDSSLPATNLSGTASINTTGSSGTATNVLVGLASPDRTLTPWATAGTLETSSVPWTVFKTIIATNDGLGISTNDYRAFPSAGYDAARGRIVAAYNTGYTHSQTNAQPVITTCCDGGRTWSLQPLPGVVPLGTQFVLTVLRNGHYLAECTTITYPGGNMNFSPTFVLGSVDGGLHWGTNGFISTGVNEKRTAPGSGLELANGNVILGWEPATTTGLGSNGVAISANEGITWTNVTVDTNGSECSLSMDSSGTIWFISRRSPDFEIYSSADNGLTWSDKGPSRISSVFMSYPAAFFLGNRMVIAGRSQPFGDSVLYYSDVSPYTNGWTQLNRNETPSLYDAPVKLSPSVALLVSAFDTAASLATTPTTSNAWVEAWVIANNGEGWKSLPSDFTSTPAVWLRNSDIPANGRMTVWPNYGSLPLSPTNSSVNGALSFPYYGQNISRLTLNLGYTNVNFGVSNVLASIWTNGVATFIWRSARTNGGDNGNIFDNCNAAQSFVGFQLKQFGANIYFSVSHGLGTTWAGRYADSCTADYSGTPHTYAVVVNGTTMRAFEDGHRVSGAAAANSGTGAYSTSDQSKFPLAVGTFGSSSSVTTPIFMGDAMIFTNALSDAEIYAWENQIMNPSKPQGGSVMQNFTAGGVSATNYSSITILFTGAGTGADPVNGSGGFLPSGAKYFIPRTGWEAGANVARTGGSLGGSCDVVGATASFSLGGTSTISTNDLVFYLTEDGTTAASFTLLGAATSTMSNTSYSTNWNFTPFYFDQTNLMSITVSNVTGTAYPNGILTGFTLSLKTANFKP